MVETQFIKFRTSPETMKLSRKNCTPFLLKSTLLGYVCDTKNTNKCNKMNELLSPLQHTLYFVGGWLHSRDNFFPSQWEHFKLHY